MPESPTSWYLVATDDGSDPAYTVARGVGVDLAATQGAGVILYDRTSESKLTNPYPSGPWSNEDDALSPDDELEPETLREMGRAYLAEQVVDGRKQGLPVRAHLAVDTGAQALSDAVERYRPSTVVFPDSIADDGGIVAKITNGTVGDLLGDTTATVILVDAEGNTRRV